MSKNVSEGTKAYYATPLFNQAGKDDNLKIAYVFEYHGYDVFLLRRDGVDGAYLEGKSEQEQMNIVFPLDVKQVQNTDILFMSLDGRTPDEGTAEAGMDLNLMISGCMTQIFKNYNGDALMEEVKEYGENNKLQEW